jgi:pimeloyl-ACP methyl ester carboxylesterase
MWDFVIPDLSQSFRVLTYDRRGHSQSERPDRQWSIRDEVADLASLIEVLGLAPAHIAGNSFGGCIVLRLAAERPDLFKSLIVHEPPFFDLLVDKPDAQAALAIWNRGIQRAAGRLEAGNIAAGACAFIDAVTGTSGFWEIFPPEMKQRYLYNAPTILVYQRDPEAKTLDLPSLSKFFHPALITDGEISPSFFKLIVSRITNVLPKVEHRTFSGAGHSPQYSDSHEYVKTITEFIARRVQPL